MFNFMTDMAELKMKFAFYAREAYELMKYAGFDIEPECTLLLNAALAIIDDGIGNINLSIETVLSYIFIARGIAEHLREEINFDGCEKISTQEEP